MKRRENEEEDSRDRETRCDISFSFFLSFSLRISSLSFLKVSPMSHIRPTSSSKDYNFKTVFIFHPIFSQPACLCSFILILPLLLAVMLIHSHLHKSNDSNERKRSLATDFIEAVL